MRYVSELPVDYLLPSYLPILFFEQKIPEDVASWMSLGLRNLDLLLARYQLR
jgi:hypothetical protein